MTAPRIIPAMPTAAAPSRIVATSRLSIGARMAGERLNMGMVAGLQLPLLLHEAVDDLLLAGLVEVDGQLVALDAADGAVAELDVENAVAALVGAGGRGFGDGDQAAVALDDLLPTGVAAAVLVGLGPA